MSKQLSVVVDADIARSSGTSEHPTSSGSRALLDAVSKNGHTLSMCPKMMSEWKVHRSLFARKWLASMIAQKKVKFIKPVKNTNNLIQKNLTDAKKIGIASKDAHLIDAALDTDKIIASNDNIARDVFCELSVSCGNIRSIKWFNSISDKSFLANYLSSQCFVPINYYVVRSGA